MSPRPSDPPFLSPHGPSPAKHASLAERIRHALARLFLSLSCALTSAAASLTGPTLHDMYWTSVRSSAHHAELTLPPPVVRHVLCGLDVEDNAALRAFTPVRLASSCLFAARARLWGADGAGADTARALALFAAHAGGLDGFVVRVHSRDTLAGHAAAVRAVLHGLAARDPVLPGGCVARRDVGGRMWVFAFGGAEFFVTSFGGCYGRGHPRWAAGVKGSSFVLLQPYSSFLLHGLGVEAPFSETRWERPEGRRDAIRVAFRKQGRPYWIPEDPGRFPAAHGIVPPHCHLDLARPEGVVKWWEATVDGDAMVDGDAVVGNDGVELCEGKERVDAQKGELLNGGPRRCPVLGGKVDFEESSACLAVANCVKRSKLS